MKSSNSKSDSDQENKSPEKEKAGKGGKSMLYCFEHMNDKGEITNKVIKQKDINFTKVRMNFNKVQLNNLLKVHGWQKPLDKVFKKKF